MIFISSSNDDQQPTRPELDPRSWRSETEGAEIHGELLQVRGQRSEAPLPAGAAPGAPSAPSA